MRDSTHMEAKLNVSGVKHPQIGFYGNQFVTKCPAMQRCQLGKIIWVIINWEPLK